MKIKTQGFGIEEVSKIISVEEMKGMPKSQLISIYESLNVWEWSELLGEKPYGWDELPNYQKPYMDECKTKKDIIHPYMRAINEIISHGEVYPASEISDSLKF